MKTKETSNQMGKCEKCGATQFLSYGTCNYNGICNGKIVPIEPSTREQALAWWNSLFYNTQQEYNYKINGGFLDWLTDDQIEEIWRKENPIAGIPNELINTDFDGIEEEHSIKPNQKQFKQFDKKLFKKYVDKFNKEDKVHALKIIAKELYSSGYSSGAFSDKLLIDIGRLS